MKTASGASVYAYDAVGNRLSRTSTIAAIPSTANTFDSNDRLNTDQYDSNGSTTGSEGKTYRYDFENRLIAINEGTPNEIRIVYDGDGNRVSKTVNGITTKYLVDTNNLTGYAQVVEELTAPSGQPSAVTRVYNYGNDLISQTQLIDNAWMTSYYGYDGHGSVRFLTDASGAITDTYTYDSFGNMISRTGTTPNNYLYCGEQWDPDIGFYFLRARYMNPSTGRFLSMDVYEGYPYQPSSLQKYVYGEADPVGKSDPSGKCASVEMLIVLTIVSTLAAISLPRLLKTGPVWPHDKISWTSSDEEGFRNFIKMNWNRYLGRTLDCADLALTFLIDYAKANRLPVVLKKNNTTLDSRNSLWIVNASLFLARSLGINARMLFDLNTDEKGDLRGDGFSRAKVGDLMMLRLHPGSTMGHTRVFLEENQGIIHYIAGDSPPIVVDATKKASEVAESTPSLRWWKGFVFGR